MKLIKHIFIISLLSAASFSVGGAATRDLELNLRVYPNPFEAGHEYSSGKYAQVWFKTKYAGTFSVHIYDLEGNLVRALSDGVKVARGEYAIGWDGRGDDGNLVAPGPYVVVLELNIQGESYRDTFIAVAYR